jgi:SAM-dependent methyltransferase
MKPANENSDLRRIYQARFAKTVDYRKEIWKVLISNFFQSFLRKSDTVLDLGCGYGEFINQIEAGRKIALDLNPDAPGFLSKDVEFHQHDCSTPWPVPDETLDIVFTSNFFEHLPDKAALGHTLDQIFAKLKPGGKLIALGPNYRHLPAAYWDFWDHHIALSDWSLSEALETRGFRIEQRIAQFLPYTMAHQRKKPIWLVGLYLALPLAWKFFGKQFLIIASKPF